MKIHENLRKSTKIDENPRKSTKIYENPRNSTKINENQRKSMKIYGLPWTSMEVHGPPWTSMDLPSKIHRKSIDRPSDENLSKIYRISVRRKSIDRSIKISTIIFGFAGICHNRSTCTLSTYAIVASYDSVTGFRLGLRPP